MLQGKSRSGADGILKQMGFLGGAPSGMPGRRGREGCGTGRAFPAVTYHHNFTYEMVDNLGKNRTEAVLGSAGQDVRRFRPVRF